MIDLTSEDESAAVSSRSKLSPIAHQHHSTSNLSFSSPDNSRRVLSFPDRLPPRPNLEQPSPPTVEPTQAKCSRCETVKELTICQDCSDPEWKRIECGYRVQEGEEDIKTPCGGDAGYCSEHFTLIKNSIWQEAQEEYKGSHKRALQNDFDSQVTVLIELIEGNPSSAFAIANRKSIAAPELVEALQCRLLEKETSITQTEQYDLLRAQLYADKEEALHAQEKTLTMDFQHQPDEAYRQLASSNSYSMPQQSINTRSSSVPALPKPGRLESIDSQSQVELLPTSPEPRRLKRSALNIGDMTAYARKQPKLQADQLTLSTSALRSFNIPSSLPVEPRPDAPTTPSHTTAPLQPGTTPQAESVDPNPTTTGSDPAVTHVLPVMQVFHRLYEQHKVEHNSEQTALSNLMVCPVCTKDATSRIRVCSHCHSVQIRIFYQHCQQHSQLRAEQGSSASACEICKIHKELIICRRCCRRGANHHIKDIQESLLQEYYDNQYCKTCSGNANNPDPQWAVHCDKCLAAARGSTQVPLPPQATTQSTCSTCTRTLTPTIPARCNSCVASKISEIKVKLRKSFD